MTIPDLSLLTPPERLGVGPALRQIERALGDSGVVELYGAQGSLGPAIAAWLAGLAPPAARPAVYLVADEDAAESRAADLAFFLSAAAAGDDPVAPPAVLHLPAPDASPYAEMQPDRRSILRRMAALFRLSQGLPPTALVASASALFRRVMPLGPFADLCHVIRAGETLNREATVAMLLAAGCTRASVVEDAGTFAVRGAVIDLFPSVYRHPVRLELFGDEIESIRLYDAATQRTLRALDLVHVHPVRETILTAGAEPRARLLAAADADATSAVGGRPCERRNRAAMRRRIERRSGCISA